MISISHTLPTPAPGNAFKAAFGPYLDRAAAEVARGMKRKIRDNRTTAFSNLVNSIHVEADGEYSRRVAPAVRHALMVERGTGPAAGQAKYFPDPRALEPWIRLRNRPGKATVRDRAWALARFISEHGTKPHPFAAPTAQEMTPRVVDLLTQGAVAGMKAQMGLGA